MSKGPESPESTPRTRDGKWKAGGPSPNPGGRKSDRELTELARTKAPEAIHALARIAGGRGLAAVRAAEAILDRALGKPQATMSLALSRGPDAGAVGGSPDQARARIEALLAEAEAGAITGKVSPASNLESGSLPALSPSENEVSADDSRALAGRLPPESAR